jgi:tRNA-dihydrouridine synthase B
VCPRIAPESTFLVICTIFSDVRRKIAEYLSSAQATPANTAIFTPARSPSRRALRFDEQDSKSLAAEPGGRRFAAFSATMFRFFAQPLCPDSALATAVSSLSLMRLVKKCPAHLSDTAGLLYTRVLEVEPFSPMQIGSLAPSNNVFLAPMAGVTDLPMRELAVELGAGLAVGEMQTADLRLADARKTQQRQRHSNCAGLRSVQLVGYDPRQLAEAARFNADLGADIIDINMGCPAKKVCRRAAGSALLADEALVGHILEAVVNAVAVPVTLKMRTGTDAENRNGIRIARLAEHAGIQMLSVHGRTRADRFKGAAEYQTIAEIVKTVSIPVIANGDIDSASKARAVLAHTGAAGIMIGRAAQGQIWLPGAIASALAEASGEALYPSIMAQFATHQRHVQKLHAFYGDHLGLRIARKHQAWFLESLVAQGVMHADLSRALRQAFNPLEHARTQLAYLRQLGRRLPSLCQAPAPGTQDGQLAA